MSDVVVPKGYKKTKVGVIPEEWEVVKLEEIFYEIKDKIGKKDIETYSISAGKGFVSQKNKFGKDISGNQNKNYILLKKNQFAYNKGNSKSYKYGCIYPNTTEKDIAVPNVFISFDFKSKHMSTPYYAKLFEHHFLDRGLRRIISSSARMDGLLNINKKYFFELLIIKPPIKEQEKIAKILTTWDEAISKQEKLIKAKEKLKKGLMQKLLSGDVRFKEFDEEWEDVRLGDICKIAKSGGTPKSTNKSYYNGSIPFLAISDITKQGKYLTYATKKISEEGLKNSSSWIVPVNTLIYSMYASVGFVSIAKIPIATSQAVINLVLKDKIELEFIYYYLVDFKKHVHKYIETGTQGNLNAKIVKNFKIKLLSLKEQQKISQVLSSVDKEIELLKKELEALKKQKKGLMQRLLTGKVRTIKNKEIN